MELKQIYEQMEGNYNNVIAYLGTDERVKKYLLKFRDKNMDVLIQNALAAEDYEIAFRESHNLKGVCANLSMDKLGASASALADALRKGKPEGDITTLVENMQSDYDMTMCALQNLQ